MLYFRGSKLSWNRFYVLTMRGNKMYAEFVQWVGRNVDRGMQISVCASGEWVDMDWWRCLKVGRRWGTLCSEYVKFDSLVKVGFVIEMFLVDEKKRRKGWSKGGNLTYLSTIGEVLKASTFKINHYLVVISISNIWFMLWILWVAWFRKTMESFEGFQSLNPDFWWFRILISMLWTHMTIFMSLIGLLLCHSGN